MEYSVEQLEDELARIHKTMDELVKNEVTFYVATVALVNHDKITWGAAEDALRLYESITGKQLAR
jgi:hypothetical protein